jgi:SAM-dependent methyltransferase
MNCIHHVPNRDLPRVLEGIRDVLVPGGLCYLGVWGGRDLEGADPDDEYPPPRFFSFRSDSTLLRAVAAVFEVERFTTFVPEDDPDPDGLHMQSFVVRRPGS